MVLLCASDTIVECGCQREESRAVRSTIVPARLKAAGKAVIVYAIIIAVTLGILDLVLVVLDVFPPVYSYGDPDVGWVAAGPTGSVHDYPCVEYSTGVVYNITRNDRGVRTSLTSDQIAADSGSYKIAVTGDSQTDLCAPNERTHAGVLAAYLRDHGVPAIELAYGAGRYSPLQAYLAYKKEVARYDPDVIVLNVYGGNDFYDILRVDDRPYLTGDSIAYEVHPPVWYKLKDPNAEYRSRVAFVGRTVLERTGIASPYFRLKFLGSLAMSQGKGWGTVLVYLRDLRKSMEPSVPYHASFSAQMLNQQLFFHHFEQSATESLNRLAALLTMVRKENPGKLLVLSVLPSYQLVTSESEADSAFAATIVRLPITYEGGIDLEADLTKGLQAISEGTGWLFVNNLPALKEYVGEARLYNDFDYHLTETASAIVGRTLGAAIQGYFQTVEDHSASALIDVAHE